MGKRWGKDLNVLFYGWAWSNIRDVRGCSGPADPFQRNADKIKQIYIVHQDGLFKHPPPPTLRQWTSTLKSVIAWNTLWEINVREHTSTYGFFNRSRTRFHNDGIIHRADFQNAQRGFRCPTVYVSFCILKSPLKMDFNRVQLPWSPGKQTLNRLIISDI